MKSVVLYVCLSCILIFFAARIFADEPQSFYDQLVTLYSQAPKIDNLNSITGIWKGECYSSRSDVDHTNQAVDTEALIKFWKDAAPPDSPLKTLEGFKFQIRPASSDPEIDFEDFSATAGSLDAIQEFADFHQSPNTWRAYFDQPEIKWSNGAEIKFQAPYLYVWLRSNHQLFSACYFRRVP